MLYSIPVWGVPANICPLANKVSLDDRMVRFIRHFLQKIIKHNLIYTAEFVCVFPFITKEWSAIISSSTRAVAAGTGKALSSARASCFSLAVSALLSAALSPAARSHLQRQTEVACPAHQLRHLLEERFRKRARVIARIRKHLDINEDAEDVLPVTPAVDVPLDVPDQVFLPRSSRWMSIPPLMNLVDDAGVIQLAGLHLAEDDVPNANLGALLLDR